MLLFTRSCILSLTPGRTERCAVGLGLSVVLVVFFSDSEPLESLMYLGFENCPETWKKTLRAVASRA